MKRIRLAHVFSYFHTLGGVEAVLRHHHEHDAKHGFDSDFIIYFETDARRTDRVHFLGLNSNSSSIALGRKRFGDAIREINPEVVLYHGLWGVPFLADLDGAKRRAVVVHGEVPRVRDMLIDRQRWMDGIACISEPLVRIVGQTLPAFPKTRIEFLRLPITPPKPEPHPRLENRPLVLGFCSRLTIEQKRVDLLPKLSAELDQLGVNYRIEFLGDGLDRALLESFFCDRSRSTFHGVKSGADYWKILNSWDALISVSDYEGTPIALLEALAMGVIPVFPAIGSGGEGYVRQVSSNFIFPKGDVGAAARSIQLLTQASFEQTEIWRRAAIRSVEVHLGDNYLTQVSAFLRNLLSLPEIKTDKGRVPPFPINHLSFTKLAKIRHFSRSLRELVLREKKT